MVESAYHNTEEPEFKSQLELFFFLIKKLFKYILRGSRVYLSMNREYVTLIMILDACINVFKQISWCIGN